MDGRLAGISGSILGSFVLYLHGCSQLVEKAGYLPQLWHLLHTRGSLRLHFFEAFIQTAKEETTNRSEVGCPWLK